MDSEKEKQAIIAAIEKKTNPEMYKTELAKKLGITRMGLFNKLKSGNFTNQEKKILISNGIIWDMEELNKAKFERKKVA